MKLTAIAAAALLSISSVNTVHDSEVTLASHGRVQQKEPIVKMVSRIAADHGVPENFAHAVIKVESNYNPKIRGAAGEYGLGQIFCATARGVGFNGKCSELLNPETNLEYSMRYLKGALVKANGDLCVASTLYNAGWNSNRRSSSYCRLVLSKMKSNV